MPLPTHIDEHTHPYLMRLCNAYKPFRELYSDTTLTSDDIKQKTYVSIKELTKDIGLDYIKEVKSRS